mmetsp:Transcript_68223/g.193276  ORF Transcript_68223/g.193276 Transcript_68223/m.193276 type:complete len:221 (-) Transcript_68223:189-851(-)
MPIMSGMDLKQAPQPGNPGVCTACAHEGKVERRLMPVGEFLSNELHTFTSEWVAGQVHTPKRLQPPPTHGQRLRTLRADAVGGQQQLLQGRRVREALGDGPRAEVAAARVPQVQEPEPLPDAVRQQLHAVIAEGVAAQMCHMHLGERCCQIPAAGRREAAGPQVPGGGREVGRGERLAASVADLVVPEAPGLNPAADAPNGQEGREALAADAVQVKDDRL